MNENTRVAVVTGANSGVGYEITKGLAKEGFRVVMACRSLDKANTARDRILADTPKASLEVMKIDVSDLDSVELFAGEFKSRFDRLDVLVNNAGILLRTPKVNSNNLEMQFATNHLGHFLLTSLLLDAMPDSRSSRVVSLSSLAHKKAEIFFEDLNCTKQSKWDAPYAQSKLACLMFADELQRRLESADRKVLSVSAHPGGTDSGLFEGMPGCLMAPLRYTLFPLFLHSNESAAGPALMAALDPDIQGGDYLGPTGLFEMKGSPGKAKRSSYSRRKDVASRLWQISEDFTNSKFEVA